MHRWLSTADTPLHPVAIAAKYLGLHLPMAKGMLHLTEGVGSPCGLSPCAEESLPVCLREKPSHNTVHSTLHASWHGALARRLWSVSELARTKCFLAFAPHLTAPPRSQERSVSCEIMLADPGTFTSMYHCCILDARQLVRAAAGVSAADCLRVHDPCSHVIPCNWDTAHSLESMCAVRHDYHSASEAWLSCAQSVTARVRDHARLPPLRPSGAAQDVAMVPQARVLQTAMIRAGFCCAALLRRAVGLGSRLASHQPLTGRLRNRRCMPTAVGKGSSCGLLLTDSLCVPYAHVPSAVFHPHMSLQSFHLLNDPDFTSGNSPRCGVRLAQMYTYDLPVDVHVVSPVEHWWCCIQYLLTSCPDDILHDDPVRF